MCFISLAHFPLHIFPCTSYFPLHFTFSLALHIFPCIDTSVLHSIVRANKMRKLIAGYSYRHLCTAAYPLLSSFSVVRPIRFSDYVYLPIPAVSNTNNGKKLVDHTRLTHLKGNWHILHWSNFYPTSLLYAWTCSCMVTLHFVSSEVECFSSGFFCKSPTVSNTGAKATWHNNGESHHTHTKQEPNDKQTNKQTRKQWNWKQQIIMNQRTYIVDHFCLQLSYLCMQVSATGVKFYFTIFCFCFCFCLFLLHSMVPLFNEVSPSRWGVVYPSFIEPLFPQIEHMVKV